MLPDPRTGVGGHQVGELKTGIVSLEGPAAHQRAADHLDCVGHDPAESRLPAIRLRWEPQDVVMSPGAAFGPFGARWPAERDG